MASPQLFTYEGLLVSPSIRRAIEKHPQLDEVTERSLLLAAQSGDIKARQKLISHNFAYICKVGGVYRQDKSHHLLLDDEVLFNQGIIGLTNAIERWSSDGGAGLQTFAYWYIRKSMQSDDSLYSDNTIRVPQSVRDQLKQIHQVIQKHEGPLTLEEIAEQTQLKVKRVETLLQIHQPLSLNVIEQGYQTELVDRIADPDTEVVSD
ncbi:RNA polymerase subunit sigma, partial [Acaryochloris marina NIES-2412]